MFRALYDRLRFRNRASRFARRVDPMEIGFLRAALRPGDLALDVGAHKGGYLYWLRRAVGEAGRVVAFEPQQELGAYLRHVVELCGYGNVEVVEQALSDRSGPARLFAPAGRFSPGASLEPGVFSENDTPRAIAAVTLDDFLAARPDLPPPRYIKIDVETHELAVLRGAARTLRAAAPVVQLEADQRVFGDRPIREVFALLEELGLSGFFFFERRLRRIRELDLAVHQPARLRANDRGYVNNFLFLSPRRDAGLLARYGLAP
jgi:FkbM family methyltransferase